MLRNQPGWVVLGLWSAMSLNTAWASEPASVLLQDGEHQVTVQDYQRMLLTLPEQPRARYQSDLKKGGEVLRHIDQHKRMAAEAERLGLADLPEVQARLAIARRQILSEALVERYRRDLQQPDFTDLAREYYQTHSEEYRLPERLDLARIQLKVDCECDRASQRTLAGKILAQLQAGESFEALARQYSDDQSRTAKGGLLTLPVKPSSADPFQTAAFALTPEQPLSGIVETPEGFYLIRLLRRHPAAQRDFESVKAGIIERLQREYMTAHLADFQARFQTSPTAVINEALLKNQDIPQ